MVTKFIEPWILFPGNLIVLLVVLGVVLLKTTSPRTFNHGERRPAVGADHRSGPVRSVGVVLVVLGIALYLLSIGFVDRHLLGRLERSIEPASLDSLKKAEAVVVLGGGVVDDPPSERLLAGLDDTERGDTEPNNTDLENDRPKGALAAEAESRLVYGYRLARRLNLPIVISGGRVLSASSVPTEAEVAQAFLLDLGAPREMILVEDQSRTTAENASQTREKFGFETVVVVTSAYHMRRAVGAFQSVGIDPLPAPTVYRTDRRPLRVIHFMPKSSALHNAATYLRETVGRIYYSLRYR